MGLSIYVKMLVKWTFHKTRKLEITKRQYAELLESQDDIVISSSREVGWKQLLSRSL